MLIRECKAYGIALRIDVKRRACDNITRCDAHAIGAAWYTGFGNPFTIKFI